MLNYALLNMSNTISVLSQPIILFLDIFDKYLYVVELISI